MINLDQLRQIACSFPETAEEPHFEKSSFRVWKKIFATYDRKLNTATIKLSPEDQDVFSLGDHGISPVPNKWGQKGWTTIDMSRVPKELFDDAIRAAYCTVAPKKLADEVRSS